MSAKDLFIEVLEEEKKSITRMIVSLETEKQNIKIIEEILEKKSEQEASKLIKQAIKEGMREKSWLVLEWLKGKGSNAR